MPAPERAGTRSRAWLALPAAPVVVVATLAGGAVLGLLAALVLAQVALLWRGAPGLAARLAGASDDRVGGRAAGSRLVAVAFGLVPALVGLATVTVVVDWGLGVVVDRVTGAPDGSTDPLDLADEDLPPNEDERADAPAYAGAAWADRYFAELAAVPMTYVPVIGPREQPVRGRYITSVDGIRRSYEPAAAARRDLPEIWFFGGSTLWGEGQRDDHTIPSEVARLAEAAGRPVRVVNFGERGYTAFQEFLLFEQELARRPDPDLAVFYHGANELYSLLESPENLGVQPSVYQLDVYTDAFHRAPPLPGQRPPTEPSLLDAYRRAGVVNRLLAGVVPPAAADDDAPYRAGPEELRRALDASDRIYRRSVRLLRHEADEAGVPALVFWQPGPQPAGPDGSGVLPPDPYAELTRRVGRVEGSIDVSDALEDPPAPVYIDGLHTNELGARVVAEALWAHVGPALAGDPGS